jgi:hypothetical protein
MMTTAELRHGDALLPQGHPPGVLDRGCPTGGDMFLGTLQIYRSRNPLCNFRDTFIL